MVIQRTPEKRENLVRLQEQPPSREVGESGRPYLLWKQRIVSSNLTFPTNNSPITKWLPKNNRAAYTLREVLRSLCIHVVDSIRWERMGKDVRLCGVFIE